MMQRRSGLILYAGEQDHLSHRIRLVLAEKQAPVEIIPVGTGERIPEDLASLNPYNTVPTLVERDLSLYDSRVILDYLEDRYPQPPLLPAGPAARAQFRQYAARLDREWSPLVMHILQGRNEAVVSAARKSLRESLITISPIFLEKPYFMSDDFTQVDCVAAPILWRLEALSVDLPERPCRGLLRYCERLFARPGFKASLSPLSRGDVR